MSRKALSATLLLIFSAACHREPPPPPKVEAPPPAPWTWHILGGVLVIKGEVEAPTELIISGRRIEARTQVPLGPVRWELPRPPKGEIAELRTGEGVLLARWDFSSPMDSSKKVNPPQTPKPPAPPKALPQTLPKSSPPAVPAKAPAPKPIPPGKTISPSPRKPAPPPPRQTKPLLPPPPLPPSQSTWPGAGEGMNLIRGPQGRRQVCLTFDGGSTAEVAEDVMEALKQRGIRTTFFLTGTFIQRFPNVVQRILADGHEVGNHTMNHPHFAPGGTRASQWTKARVQEELLAADAAFYRLTGRPMDPLWRAPYGEQTKEIRAWAEELGYRHVHWSEGADTLDWATSAERKLYRSGPAILERLRTRMAKQDGDGLIVLMHLGSGRPEEDRPAKTLGPFLDRAKAEGWRFVTASSYLDTAGKPSWNRSLRISYLTGGGGGQGQEASPGPWRRPR